MKKYSKTITLITALFTLVLSYYALTTPSIAGFAFILWALSPYGYLLMLIKLVSCKPAINAAFILSLITCLFGLATLLDSIFIHPDAQSGLVFAATPLWQWAGLIAISIPLVLFNKIKNTA